MICCICVDADWAHPEVTAHTLDRLERSGVPFTFFATDDQLPPASPHCEIAWHPNFERGPARTELALLKERFPGACGVRPHRLSWGDCDHATLIEFGTYWTSSTYRPHEYLPLRASAITEVSISWGDNWWFLKQLAPDFRAMQSDTPGIYVLNIHPIHVFLNTVNLEQYEQAKVSYRHPDALRALRVPDACGVSYVLNNIIEVACAHPGRFLNLSNALKFCRTDTSFHKTTENK